MNLLHKAIEQQRRAAQILSNLKLNLPDPIRLPEGNAEYREMLRPLADALNQTIAVVQEMVNAVKQHHEQLVWLTQLLLKRRELPAPASPDDDCLRAKA